jgi:acetylornithine deacetylase/succinyl-diaminopimelate desuccinylase-like protein
MTETKLLSELVAIDSIFPNEAKIGEFLEQKLQMLGFRTSRNYVSRNRFNVLAEKGSGKRILLYGHMDTVPIYGDWHTNPLKLTEKDGRIYGLGAYDMKAGIAAILEACNNENVKNIKIAFGVDEENDSQGAYGITKTEFLKDVSCVLVPEISEISNESNGTNTIMLGRRGRVQYQVDVKGESAHAAFGNGVNAITEASKVAIEIEKANNELPTHEHLPKGNQFVRKFFSESLSLSIPDSAKLIVDRQLVIPENAESGSASLQQIANRTTNRASVSVVPREVPYLMPYITSQQNEYVQRLANIVEQQIGNPNYSYGYSPADENLFAMQNLPVISYGPIGSNQHSADEWVSKKSYLELIQVLKAFLEQVSSSQE